MSSRDSPSSISMTSSGLMTSGGGRAAAAAAAATSAAWAACASAAALAITCFTWALGLLTRLVSDVARVRISLGTGGTIERQRKPAMAVIIMAMTRKPTTSTLKRSSGDFTPT